MLNRLWQLSAKQECGGMFEWLDPCATGESGLTQLAVTRFFFAYLCEPRFTALCQKLNVQLPAMSGKP